MGLSLPMDPMVQADKDPHVVPNLLPAPCWVQSEGLRTWASRGAASVPLTLTPGLPPRCSQLAQPLGSQLAATPCGVPSPLAAATSPVPHISVLGTPGSASC